jgi:hypothetical protein
MDNCSVLDDINANPSEDKVRNDHKVEPNLLFTMDQ